MPKTERAFGQAKEYPTPLAPEVRKQLMLEALANLQKIERDSVGRDSVLIPVNHNNPIEVVCVSDLHIGALATNNENIVELVEYVLSHENVMVVLLGDEVEGIKKEYLDTNRTPLDLQQQIDLLRLICLKPLAEEGRIGGMVSGYWGHPGWAQDATTINIWSSMTQGLNIPILKNGGELQIKFANGHTQKIKIRHNPPGGNDVDPVSGLRKAELALSSESRSNGAMSGHIHRMAIAKEWYFGADSVIYYISAGTEKGSTVGGVADRYGEKLGGKPLCDPLGQGVILQPRTRQKEQINYPYPSRQHGQIAFEAMTLLNAAERQGITRELKEKIWHKVEKAPKTIYHSETSVLSNGKFEDRPQATGRVGKQIVENQYSKMKMRAPYDTLTFDIQTELPIALKFIQNARIGRTDDEDTLRRLGSYVEKIKENPHSFVVYLRNMIDKTVGRSPERVQALDNLIQLVNGAQSQTLAIMLDESMRKDDWKASKGKDPWQLPVAPASYVSTYTDVRLIHHLSLIKLAVGPSVYLKEKPLYIGAFADKLLGSGSFSQPTFGLKQLYSKYLQKKPGYVVGGHMPSSGTYAFHDYSNTETDTPLLVAPGWWSDVDTMGKGNVMPGSRPGQAVIFMPGESRKEYLAFPTVDASETENLHDALTLLVGLEKLGLTRSVLKKTK